MILYDNKGAVYSAVHAHVLPAQLSAIAIEIKPVGILNIPVDPSREGIFSYELDWILKFETLIYYEVRLLKI